MCLARGKLFLNHFDRMGSLYKNKKRKKKSNPHRFSKSFRQNGDVDFYWIWGPTENCKT